MSCALPPEGFTCSRTKGHDGPCATSRAPVRYGDWHIKYNPPPIPTRACDWQFWHDVYDGAEDAYDNRCGSAASLADAQMQIDCIEDCERDLTPEEEARVKRNADHMLNLMEAQRAQEMRREITHLLYAIDRGYFTDSEGLAKSAFVTCLRKWEEPGFAPVKHVGGAA